MKRIATTALMAAGLALSANAVLADGHGAALEKAIKARKALMQIYSFNLGGLGAMAKGEAKYDAKLASALAGSLENAAKANVGAMWPQGSDSTAMPGKTRALLKAWETYPESKTKQEALQSAAGNLVKVAGNGVEALKAAVGEVGKSCGGCHKPFRAPKK